MTPRLPLNFSVSFLPSVSRINNGRIKKKIFCIISIWFCTSVFTASDCNSSEASSCSQMSPQCEHNWERAETDFFKLQKQCYSSFNPVCSEQYLYWKPAVTWCVQFCYQVRTWGWWGGSVTWLRSWRGREAANHNLHSAVNTTQACFNLRMLCLIISPQKQHMT